MVIKMQIIPCVLIEIGMLEQITEETNFNHQLSVIGVEEDTPEECPAKQWNCLNCERVGHMYVMFKKRTKNVNAVQESEDKVEEPEDEEILRSQEYCGENKGTCGDSKGEQGAITNGSRFRSTMYINVFYKYFQFSELLPVKFKLKVVLGEKLNVLGQIQVVVEVNNSCKELKIVIVDTKDEFLS